MTVSMIPDLGARLVFVGGPPRGGTTLAMRLLESHPNVLGIIHDHVHEFWPLYYYGDRSGVVADLRRGQALEAARRKIHSGLFRNGWLECIADAPHTASLPDSLPPERPDGHTLPADAGRQLHRLQEDQIPGSSRICVKSPEISHVLLQLSAAFPDSRFVIAFRPIEEIAESMFRMGNRVKRVDIFHRRWRKDDAGDPENAIPPGVPFEWQSLWRGSGDFSRCVIYGASFLHSLARDIESLDAGTCFVYSHVEMRRRPGDTVSALARFLGMDPAGMEAGKNMVKGSPPLIPRDLMRSCGRMVRKLRLGRIEKRLQRLARISGLS